MQVRQEPHCSADKLVDNAPGLDFGTGCSWVMVTKDGVSNFRATMACAKAAVRGG